MIVLLVIGVVLVALWSFSAAVVAGRADRRGEEMRERARDD